MFTGLIDDVGVLTEVGDTPAGREFRIQCRYEDLTPGESVAVNGVCLTVRECGYRWFAASAVVTTLGRTTMESWRRGRRVNLERALCVGDRLGGHFVQGHVDGVAAVDGIRVEGDARLVDLVLSPGLADLTVCHGSIAIDGVSLTVNAVLAAETLQVSLIEYTLRHTTFAELEPGARVNVEVDMLGKYVQRLLKESTT